MMEGIKDTLLEDWSSFGMLIGKKEDTITPLSLLELVEYPSEPETGNLSDAMPPKEIENLFWVIVGSFRIMNFANSRRQDTSENVSIAIQGVLTSSPIKRIIGLRTLVDASIVMN